MSQLDTDSLLKTAISTNQGYADKFGVGLTLQKNSQPKLTIFGDETRLLQVLSNLISNAIKFSPDQGVVELSFAKKLDMVRILVTDHGPGIPKEFQERIFQKFAQGDSSDTRQQGGTGLGLAISKTIIEQHSGVIGYETKLGEGSMFYIELPTTPTS